MVGGEIDTQAQPFIPGVAENSFVKFEAETYGGAHDHEEDKLEEQGDRIWRKGDKIVHVDVNKRHKFPINVKREELLKMMHEYKGNGDCEFAKV